MSHLYRMQLEIRPAAEEELGSLKEEAADVFERIDGHYFTDSSLSFLGELTLGTAIPEDIHVMIKERFKKLGKEVNTRWLCLDLLPWDDEFEGFKEAG